MAYQFLWIDGFDYENDFGEVYIPGVEYRGNAGKVTSGVPYSYGRAAEFNYGSWAENYIYKVLPGAPFTTLFIAFHWNFNGLDSNERVFMQFWDNVTNLMQMEVRRIYDGVTGTYLFRLYRGNTLLATTPVGANPSQWSWLSFKCHCDPSAGNFQININGINRLNYTGNTRNGSVTQMHRIKLTNYESPNGVSFKVDNLVIAAGDPSDPPLPDCRVFGAIVPTANDSIQFTPNTGSNWSNLDEIGPDNDTTYNYSSTVGHTDTFVGSPPAVSNVIYAVKANVRARKDDAGLRTVCPVIKPTTTVYEGAESPVTPNYFTYGHIWETNPETGNPWTPTEISNLKWGYRLKS